MCVLVYFFLIHFTKLYLYTQKVFTLFFFKHILIFTDGCMSHKTCFNCADGHCDTALNV